MLHLTKMEKKEATADGPKTSSTHPGVISSIPDVGLSEISDKKGRSPNQKDEGAEKSSVDSTSRKTPGKISRYLEKKENNVKRNQPDPAGTSQNPSKKNSTDHLGIPHNSARNSKPDPIGTPRSTRNKHPDPIRAPRNKVGNNSPDPIGTPYNGPAKKQPVPIGTPYNGPAKKQPVLTGTPGNSKHNQFNSTGTPHNSAQKKQPDRIGTPRNAMKNNQFDPTGTPHNITQNKQRDRAGTPRNTTKKNQFDPTGTPTNTATARNNQPGAIGTPRKSAGNKQPDPIGTPQRAAKKNQPDPIGTPRQTNLNDSKRNRPSQHREEKKKQPLSENIVGVEDTQVKSIKSIKQRPADKTQISSDQIDNIPSNNNKISELSASLVEDETLQSTFEEGSSMETSFDQPSMEGEGDGKQCGDGLTKGDSKVHHLPLDNQPFTEEDQELKAKGIFKLHKKKLKFPRAKYFCRLCNYHMDNLKDCEDHISQTRHNRLMKNKIATENFQELPKLSSSHLEALSSTLEDVVKDVGLTDEMMAERQVVADRVNSIIRRVMPDCQVDMYGSSVSGFGFKTSGVNLNIKTTGKMTAAELLLAALEIITIEKKCFKSVDAKFEEKFPVISFIDTASNLNCELGINNEFAVNTSHLLLVYRNSDPRVRTLGIAFRYWAHLLEIDKPWDGSVPAYVYVIMVIFFLQRCLPPVVPVIQEGEQLKEENQLSTGELWVKLFHFYLVEINIEEEIVCITKRPLLSRKAFNLPNRRIVIVDPCAQDKKALTKYLSSAEIFSFIMDGIHIALEYFSSSNGLGMKDLASISFDPKQTVASTSSSDDRKNPSEGALPLSESTQVEKISIDRDEGSILKCGSHPGDDVREVNTALNDKLVECVTDTNTAPTDMNAALSGDQVDGATIVNTALTEDNTALIGDIGGEVKADTRNNFIKESEVSLSSHGSGVDEEDGIGISKLTFVFDKDKLTGGQNVPKICSNCQQEGHLSKDCEDDKLPDMVMLPPMEASYLDKIQQLCKFVSDNFSPTIYEIQERNYIIRELEHFIQTFSGTDIRLALFGSSVNGFGFQNSDLDICMTFNGDDTGQDINVPEVIQSLAQILRKNQELYNVIPITTAKVPIVKFMHRRSQLEGDISLYNILAQHNTRLLKTYSEIDRRVCRLGHMVKAFAKECDIADASRGSLSSYAYILLTLYFLQQTTPPVIPVLQELHKAGKKPERLVEGRNTWFFENIRNLRNVWNGVGRNRLSEAELWLDFLKFYTEKFDFTKYVVCIRQYKKLTRFEKMWMGKGFAIEDPFDLDHNLGGALSRRMANYITVIFRKGRERFGTPQSVPRQMYNFFLDYDFLTDGQSPPNDRGCRICGKIGHYVKDCPIKLRGKEKKRARATAGKKNVSQDSTETTNSQGSTTNSRTPSTPNNSSQGSHVSGAANNTKQSVNQPPSQSKQRTSQSNTAPSSSKVGSSKERQRNRTNGEETTREVEESGQVKSPLATKTPSTDEMSPPRSAVTPSEPIMTPSRPVMAPQQQPAISPSRPAMTPPSLLSPSVLSRLQGSPNRFAGSPPQPLFPFGVGSPTRTSPPSEPIMTPSRPVMVPQKQPAISPSRPAMTPPSLLSPSVLSGLQGSPNRFAGSPPLPLFPFGVGSPTRTSSSGHMSPIMYSPSGTFMYPRSPVPFASQPYQMPMPPSPSYMVQNPHSYQPFQTLNPPAEPRPSMEIPINLNQNRVAIATAELQQLLGVVPSPNTQPQPKIDTPFGATSLQEGPS